MAYGDGPPYSEDEDLHSPVVASRPKKSRSAFQGIKGRGQNIRGDGLREDDDLDIPPHLPHQRHYFAGTNGDGSETYYIGTDDDAANGPGGELVTYPPDSHPQGLLAPKAFGDSQRSSRNPHFDNDSSVFLDPDDESRLSRDYQFTIASPDEEMHGKAVALFDFARENENELPLLEGQVIWVSYRHGQGWLVAEDPKTGDAGLVPEEYVRLLRDIEGGWTSLNGDEAPDATTSTTEEEPTSPSTSPDLNDTTATTTNPPNNQPAPATGQFTNSENLSTPTVASTAAQHFHHGSLNNNTPTAKEKRPATVSTFSTSSKDLETYPHHLLGQQAGATPPTVVHHPGGSGSGRSTPTVMSPVLGSGGSASALGGVREEEEGSEGSEEKGSKVANEEEDER